MEASALDTNPTSRTFSIQLSSQPCRRKYRHVMHGLARWLHQTTLTRGSDRTDCVQANTADSRAGKDGSPRTDKRALSDGTRTRRAPRCVALSAGETALISLKENEGGRRCECVHLSVCVRVSGRAAECVCVSTCVRVCSPTILLKGDAGTSGVGKEVSHCTA